MRRSFLIPLLAFAVAPLFAAGCGGGSSSSTSTGKTASAAVAAPAGVANAGKIVYCTDITYPPEEFYKGSTPTGSDIDIGTAIGNLMAVKAEFDNTGFDGIIPALLSKKCDAIISGMNDTPQRRTQVDFVDYLRVGQSLMVAAGNPENIASLADLSGKSVSVEVGTTNAGFLQQESSRLGSQGKPGIDVVTFPKDTDAANALKTGKVDAYFGDSPVVAYYIAQDPSSFAFGGQPINPIPVGIALRKDETQLRADVQEAVHMLYRNGTMGHILGRWKMSQFELKS
jgi:polar amino acid transport system substrate-binding protein